jgi:threonine aldolase
MIPNLTPDEKAALKARCTRFLSHARPRSAADWVAAMGASPHLELGLDSYSAGPAIARLERTVADLLGKPAGLWLPKGVVAQQAALKVHAAVSGRVTVAIHPKSHIAIDEAGAIERLAGLTAIRVGADAGPFNAADLERIAEALGAVVLELPLRRSAFQAPAWDDLVAVSDWARANGVAFHLDGARIWEVQPYYDRPLAEIAALADSVYVSLYKGLGGLGGCVLAGTEALVEAAKPWRTRYGGDLPSAFPMIITALDGLETTLPKMGGYHRRARELAAAIDTAPGLRAFPNPPHGNAFQVHFRVPAAAMQAAALAEAIETGTWLFNAFEQGLLPDASSGELSVGEATMDWTAAEVVAALTGLAQRAEAG